MSDLDETATADIDLAGAMPSATSSALYGEVHEALFGPPAARPPADDGSEPRAWVRRLRERLNRTGSDTGLGPTTEPISLRFCDAEIEADYRRKLVPRARKQLRTSLISSLLMWSIGGLIALPLLADGRSIWVANPSMLGFLLVLLGFERKTTSPTGLNAIGAISNTTPGLTILAILWFEGVFGATGSLMTILVMVFSFSLLSIPFLASLLAVIPYLIACVVLLYVVPGVEYAGLQTFAIGMSFITLALSAHARESAARRDFYLTRVIADQERELEQERAKQLGQYTLGIVLGRGGMGVVHRARHAMLRRPTAVKLLSIEDAGPEDLRRFEREVQLTSELSHPNIIAIYDYGRSPLGEFYYAMEYVAGLDLESLVVDHGPLAPERAVPILAQICDALDEAHSRGLVHRDIKPANVLLARIGTRCDVVKVVDFGLVRELGQGDDAPRGIAGTPAYIAPEVIRSPSAIEPANDIYAVGALGFFLLTGERAVAGATIPQIFHNHLTAEPRPPSAAIDAAIPAVLDELILDCLAKDPRQRPTAAEMAAALRRIPLARPDHLHDWWEAFDASTTTKAMIEQTQTRALTVVLADR